MSEHVGRFQVGVAGFYAVQVQDDKLFGTPYSPDGRRIEILELGPVLNYDMLENLSSMKLKALFTPLAANTVTSWGLILSWVKKL